MFRTKRTHCVALALLLSALLLPLPAMAGSFGEPASATLSWDGLWADLMAWLGIGTQADSSFIDPLGGPNLNAPSRETAEDSSSIDPLGGGPYSSSYIDPNGNP